MKKNITLYIQGVNYLSSNLTFLRWLIDLGYHFINAKPNYKTAHPDWLTQKNTKSEFVIPVEWKADLNPLSKILAVKKLQEAIDEYKNIYTIIIVGTSLGGLIATDVLKHFTGNEVSNLILIGSINTRKHINLNGIKILNIYSKQDSLARLAIRLLAPFRGSQELIGENVINISIDRVRHDQLFKNNKINTGIYKDRTIGEAIHQSIGM